MIPEIVGSVCPFARQNVFACFMLGYPETDIHFSRSIPRQLNSITI